MAGDALDQSMMQYWSKQVLEIAYSLKESTIKGTSLNYLKGAVIWRRLGSTTAYTAFG